MTSGQPSETYPPARTILIVSAILLLTMVVYSHSLGNGFVNFDDDENVYVNPSIRELSARTIKLYFTTALLEMYTPLVSLSYAIDYQIGGLDPRIYHATNLLVHLLNIALLFSVVRLLTRRIEMAAIVALFFAVHPLNTGAVAPVSTRSTLLYSVFFLAAFLFYIRYLRNDFRPRYLAATLVLFLLALLSKSAAVVLPLVLLLTDYYERRKIDLRAIAEKIPFFVLSLIFGVLTFVFRSDTGYVGRQYAFSAGDGVFLVGYSVLFYIFKILIPVKLSAYHPYPLKTGGLLPLWFYLSPVAIAAGLYVISALKNCRREVLFGVGFFFINIVLVLKIIPLGGEMICDRYAYLPAIGLFLIIGWSYCRIADRSYGSAGRMKSFFIIALAAYGMAGAAISYDRTKVWKDSLTLFNDVIEQYPSVALAYYNRGTAKVELGKDHTGAVADFDKAIALDPGYFKAYYNRGTARMVGEKDYAGAMADYTKAIELRPDLAQPFHSRGILYAEQGEYERAIADYTRALEIMPTYVEAYVARGYARQASRDYHGAMEDYQKALALNPRHLPSLFHRASLQIAQSNRDGALADYTRILEIDPRNFRAYYERGNLKISRKDYEEAERDYNMAIAVNPAYAEAYQNRGNVRMLQKRYAESSADYSEALRLAPQNAGVYFNRGRNRWNTSDRSGACADWRSALALGAREAAAVLQTYCNQ